MHEGRIVTMERCSSFFWDSDSRARGLGGDDSSMVSSPSTVGLNLSEDDVEEGTRDQREALLQQQQQQNRRRSASNFIAAAEGSTATTSSVTATTTTDRSPLLGARGRYGSTTTLTGGGSRDKIEGFGGAERSIRFQVVVWYVGAVDVVLGHVPMKFRVTLFWNDATPPTPSSSANGSGTPGAATSSSSRQKVWTMQGRQRAVRQDVGDADGGSIAVDVPPLSILNVASFDVVGSPEVHMLRKKTRLMRWTCLYNATIFQENMRVDNFPHDRHELVLKLGILAHRRVGSRWDRTVWRLALATEADSQGSTTVPHGLIVDHVTIPDFTYDVDEGLRFDFVPLTFGSAGDDRQRDRCLQVKLTVRRDSGHYDKNIMPLIGLLNVVAISCLARNFASSTASTELMLSIAFVAIGIRLSVDSRLPSVGYQIKMQCVLNKCFWLLFALVLESNLVHFLVMKMGVEISTTDVLDCAAAAVAVLYTAYMFKFYYSNMGPWPQQPTKGECAR